MLQSLILLNDKSVPISISNPQANTETQHYENDTNNKDNSNNNLLTRYHSRTPPLISTFTYLTRLTKFNNFNQATLLTTIYYIDLLSHQYQPFFTLNSWTVHRFLLVATMIAQKSLEDFFYTNDHYAKVGGVVIGELNCLELDFLNRIDWRCIPGKQINNNNNNGNGDNSKNLTEKFCPIRYAKDVLNMYYFQLIKLMGKNVDKDNSTFNNFHFVKESWNNKSKEEDEEDEEEADDVIYDDYDEEDEEEEDEEEEDEEDDDDEYDEEDEGDVVEDEYFSNGVTKVDNDTDLIDKEIEDEQRYDHNEDYMVKKLRNENYIVSDDLKENDEHFNNKQEDLNDKSVPIDKYKYDTSGRNIDGSSSPHLKRHYSKYD
ncbi:unnamed protein product [Candida verbasci]|uniref:Cyclin n=1 Tax=Candida verbasci TaxID=1227364 RepID=A0A9W4XNK4_9ASCO|nr:unnamed protein product [Candida verbasci]